MYYTGIHPFTKEPVHIAKHLRDRKLQRALMQFFKPENYFEVRAALQQAGRQDLIGNGCDALIPTKPPREAIERRRKDANQRFRGEYVHKVDGEQGSSGPETDSSTRKKGSRKQSRHAAGPGFRPDAKKARRGTDAR
jgi:hypothetical protein